MGRMLLAFVDGVRRPRAHRLGAAALGAWLGAGAAGVGCGDAATSRVGAGVVTGSGGAGAGGTGGSGGGGGSGGAAVCVPGATTACYSGPPGTEGVGTCKAGAETCVADGSGFGPCAGEVTPQPQDCAHRRRRAARAPARRAAP